MGIFFGGAAVGGPAGVSDAVGAVERLQAQNFFEVAELALGAANLHASAVPGYCDSGGVGGAKLQLSPAVADYGDYLLLPYISHNAAHLICSLTNASVGADGSP